MKKGERNSAVEGEISSINYLIRMLGMHVQKLEEAYKKKDHREFNIIKKEIIQIQKKIHTLI
ncbi:MAG: hypothetical protein ABSG05_00990 [Candidatus Pacearchaeota archaeon]|jgi:hypothetical protein